jgi:hemoglobin-like flavoprotein
MGAILSLVFSFFAPTRQIDQSPDPATGLTPNDRQLLTETWRILTEKDQLKPNAIEFFVQLFEEHPYQKDFFKNFKDKSPAELRRSPKLKFHATSVFYAITAYVDNVDDPETLIGLIHRQAINHIERKVFFKHFEDLKHVFLKFVKSQLGAKGTPEVVRAWDKLLTAHNNVLKAKQEEEMGQKQAA